MAKYILPGNFIIANPRYGINIYTSHGEGVFKSFDNFSFYGTNGTYDHNHPCFITDDDTVEFKQNNEDLTDFKFKEFDFPEHDFTYGRLEEATADNIEKREVKYKGIISQIGGCATEVINITAPSLSVWVVCVPDISYLFKVSNYLPENLFSNTDYLFPGAFYNSNLKSTDKKSFFIALLLIIVPLWFL
ncbi:MAG: hypothetical protein CV045_10040 [Cyanobacteria bacterium M5B4]|nr:MAG: hypothetical protein CV045_10040 [Cyanobacteria bacterium M5B4]